MGHLKDCNQRYGAKTCRELKRRLIGGTKNGQPYPNHLIWVGIYARYGYADGRKTCLPTITKKTYNKHAQSESRRWLWSQRLRASNLYEHWLAQNGEIERMIAYVNRCPMIGGKRIGLFMIDIDCHSGQPMREAKKTAALIEKTLGVPIYWEPSTTGSGMHGYIMLSWNHFSRNKKISEDLLKLGQALNSLTSAMKAGCGEVRGAPMIIEKKSIVKTGSWAKIPRPQTKEDADALLMVMNSESGFELVMNRVSQGFEKAGVSYEKAGVRYDRGAGVLLGEHEDEVQESTGLKGPTVLGYKESTRPHKPLSQFKTITLDELKDIADTFQRTLQFIKSFRATNPNANESEAYAEYVRAELEIGKSDRENFAGRWKCISKTFDPTKSKGKGIEGYLPEATGLILGAINNNGLVADLRADLNRRRAVYRRQGRKQSTIASLRRLDQDRLAKLYACMMWELKDQPKTWGKAQAQTLMLQVFGLKVSNKEFRASMRWLRRNRLVRLSLYQIPSKNKTGHCRVYEVRASQLVSV